MKHYLRVDLHRAQFTVFTRQENGITYLRQWAMRELTRFAAQLHKSGELAVEDTGNTRLFYDQVLEHVARVVVVNPKQFKVISQPVKKTDGNDELRCPAATVFTTILTRFCLSHRFPRESLCRLTRGGLVLSCTEMPE